MKKSLLLFLILFSFCTVFHAQEFNIKTYTTKDGLSSNFIYDVYQDKQGFLWIATSNGLNRFDGNVFDCFYNNPNDSNSIAGNQILCFYEDKKGQLWMGTNEGISLYHPTTQSFSNYTPDTSVQPVIGTYFKTMMEDDAGNFWVGSRNDLLLFNPQTGNFSSSNWASFATEAVGNTGNHWRVTIEGLVKKSDNELWILSSYGLFSVNVRNNQFKYYPIKNMEEFFEFDFHYADNKGNVFIGLYRGGFLEYNSQNKELNVYHVKNELSQIDYAFCVKQYNNDTLMFCSDYSIGFFDVQTKKVIKMIRFDKEDRKKDDLMLGKCLLKTGNQIWVGTEKGIVQLTPKTNQFSYTQLNDKAIYPLRIYPLQNGNLLLGTTKNAYFFKHSSLSAIKDAKNNSISSGYLFCAETADSAVYFNDDDGHLYMMKNNKLKTIKLPEKRHIENENILRNMVVDKEGFLWIRNSTQGIIRYDRQKDTAKYIDELPSGKTKRLAAFYYDKFKNTLWIAEDNSGVYSYDMNNKIKKHFLLNRPDSKRGGQILCFSGDEKGKIWMADFLSGILEYDYKTEKFKRYTISDGLLSNNVLWLTYDKHNYVWICTNLGLSRYNTSTGYFDNFPTEDGFPNSHYEFINADKNGNIYLGYKNGFYSWNSTAIPYFAINGRFYLRKVQLLNDVLAIDSNYTFNYNQNKIQFLFGWISFTNKAPRYIEYKLNNQPWVTIELSSNISFDHLEPNNYILQIRDKNHPSIIFTIRFTIKAALWQHWWFIAIIIISVLLMGYFIFKSRLNSVRQKANWQSKLMESEMSALRSQMNPHFIFNTLNSINSYILENKSDEASNYLTDFSKLMRMILEHSRKELITLDEELKALKLYLELEAKRLENSFDYRIGLDNSLDVSSIKIPPLIIQPFAENAIWHGLRHKKGHGFIDIDLKIMDSKLVISITDNGVGRKYAAQVVKVKDKTSFGIDATIKRIHLVDKQSQILIHDLYNEQNEATGTRVEIFIHLN